MVPIRRISHYQTLASSAHAGPKTFEFLYGDRLMSGPVTRRA
jgi:hypothetical protein